LLLYFLLYQYNTLFCTVPKKTESLSTVNLSKLDDGDVKINQTNHGEAGRQTYLTTLITHMHHPRGHKTAHLVISRQERGRGDDGLELQWEWDRLDTARPMMVRPVPSLDQQVSSHLLTPAPSSTLAASSFCACKGYCSRSSGRRKACCIFQRHAPQAHPWGVCNPTVSRLSPPVLLSHASSLAGALAHGGFLHSRRRTGPRRPRRLFFDGGGRGSWAARPPPFPISLFMVPSLPHRGEQGPRRPRALPLRSRSRGPSSPGDGRVR
jgi:hypothetical protein